MDSFIHNELQDYVNMGSCKLYVVKRGGVTVAMFCLENSYLALSEQAKENMREGKKPMPEKAPEESDDYYWIKPLYQATEITYLAVADNEQHKHIGATIIESVVDKVAHSKEFQGEFVTVRALNQHDYTAIPFYEKCGFTPAVERIEGQNLFMYRLVPQLG